MVPKYEAMLNAERKRSRSEAEETLLQPQAKKSALGSIKNYFLGALGLKSHSSREPVAESNKRAASQPPERPAVTAKQLQSYYLSLKNENSTMLQDIAEMKTSTRENPELDSFVLSNKDAESTMIKEQQVTAKREISLPTAEEQSLPTTYNDSILPDPLERANLIQLKKMMELDRYRKLRMNYLRKHTRHVDRSGIAKMAKELREKKKSGAPIKSIKDIPLQRRNMSGIFGISMLDKLAQEYDEEDEEPAKTEVADVNPNSTIAQKLKFNTTSKLDKMETKRKSVVPEKAVVEVKVNEKPVKSVVETPSGGFLFGASDKADKKTESTTPGASAPAFSFEKTAAKEEKAAAPAFSFGQSADKKEENKESAPAFSFSGATSDNKGAAPKLSFGGVEKKEEKPAPAFSFGASDKKEEKVAAPVFSFAAPKLAEETPAEKKPADSKPTFGFSLDQNAEKKDKPAFGGSAEKTAAPAFSFGGSTEKKEPSTIPSLFGKQDSKDEGKSDIPATPAFSFGAASKEGKSSGAFSFGGATTDKPDTAAKPAFSFGSAVKNDTKPASSFTLDAPSKGEKADTPAEPVQSTTSTAPAAAFSFGAPVKVDAKPATSFSFGASKTDSKSDAVTAAEPVAPAAPATPAAPAFSFGGVPSTDKPASGAAPAFSFGASAASGASGASKEEKEDAPAMASSFSFGAKPAAPTETKPAASGFSFGQKPDGPATGSAFSFGQSASKAASPAFSFGDKEEAKPESEKKRFRFETAGEDPPAFAKMGGNLGVEAKPSAGGFSFGGNNSTPSLGFGMKPEGKGGFGNAATPSGFSFGSNSATPAPAPTSNGFSFGTSGAGNINGNTTGNANGSGPAASGFGFGSGPASAVTSGGNTPNAFQFGAAAKSNAGTNGFPSGPAASAPSAFGFTPNSGPPDINFTGGQTTDLASVFQAGTAAPPGGPRKKAQLRRRVGRR